MDERLTKPTIVMMIIVAVVIDLVQIILDFLLIGLVLNYIIDPFAWITFYLWFRLNGVKFGKPTRALSMGAAIIIELIPVLSALPGWTAMVVITSLSVKASAIAQKLHAPETVTKTVGKMSK